MLKPTPASPAAKGQLQTAAEKVLGGDKSLSKMDEYIQEFDRQILGRSGVFGKQNG